MKNYENLNKRKIQQVKDEQLGQSSENVSHLIRKNKTSLSRQIIQNFLKKITFLLLAFVVVYFFNKYKEDNFRLFVSTKDEILNIPLKKIVPCFNQDYALDRQNYPTCAPKKCARLIIDNLINSKEIDQLTDLVNKLFSLTISNSSAYIADLHSGALTYRTSFINFYMLLRNEKLNDFITQKDFDFFETITNRIRKFIVKQFDLDENKLYLTKPTFFSKLTNKKAVTLNDQYWNKHIDKFTYKSFVYTSLLYLTTYKTDFDGGRFVFQDKSANYSIEPKKGRLSIFTSGSENPHFVEKVQSGLRLAATISFTCNPSEAVAKYKL